MSDLDLFTNSEEERDRTGCFERPITYKDYVGLSKSSSLLKSNCCRERRPLVLQISCNSEDELPPSSRPSTDQRRNLTDDHHIPRRVLPNKEKVLHHWLMSQIKTHQSQPWVWKVVLTRRVGLLIPSHLLVLKRHCWRRINTWKVSWTALTSVRSR